jgi:hypothetical protein
MVALPFPAPGALRLRRRSLSGGEILGQVRMQFPTAKMTAGGCEPFAGEPRSRETDDGGHLSGGLTPWRKATR